MASSLLLLHNPVLRPSTAARCSAPSAPPPLRRRSLLLVAPTAGSLAWAAAARAKDIPLFGIRKSSQPKKVEEEENQIVQESEKATEQAVAAVAGVEEISSETAAEFAIAGDLVQAGAVAGAEAVGVILGLTVVNGILGSEAKKS